MGPNIPSFQLWLGLSIHWPPIWEPTESYLFRAKSGLITQEILRDLGALCQEPGPKAKYKELVAETSAYLYCCPAVSPASIVSTSENSDRRGLGGPPWLTVFCVCCHTSVPGR